MLIVEGNEINPCSNPEGSCLHFTLMTLEKIMNPFAYPHPQV